MILSDLQIARDEVFAEIQDMNRVYSYPDPESEYGKRMAKMYAIHKLLEKRLRTAAIEFGATLLDEAK